MKDTDFDAKKLEMRIIVQHSYLSITDTVLSETTQFPDLGYHHPFNHNYAAP